MRFRFLLVGLTLVCVLIPAASAQAQANRTWVSGVGDDANPCSRTAPCITFAGAISKTAEGGEINAIDAGGFGPVNITKAITIDIRNVHGGPATGGAPYAVQVNAGADDDVVLRGLDILGTGPGGGCAPYGGVNGIRVLSARSVRIEDTTIARMAQNGVRVAPTAADTKVLMNRVEIGQTCGAGLEVAPGAGRKADVSVVASSIFQAGKGVLAGEGAHVWLKNSSITGNAVGLETAGNGIIDSYWGTNHLTGNTVDGSPTNVLGAPPATSTTIVKETVVERVPAAAAPLPTPVSPVAPAVVAPPPGPSLTPRCVVPRLTGLTIARATARLRAAGCTLGRRTPKATRSARRVGRVTAQGVAPGTSVPAGRRVAVTVGRRAR